MEKTFLLQKDSSKTYCKKTQGITLIALVVTIVVLLILASVTISAIFSDNGIIKKAQEAANKTKEAVEQEQAELNQLYNDLASIMNNTTGGSTEEPTPPEPEEPPIDKVEPKVGYYADIDGDGTPDGVIYADLAVSKSGQWMGSDGTYSYTAKTNTKDYYISQTNYEGPFGTKDVLTAIDGEGEDRFYVMALEDFNTGTSYCWYDDAYGNMDDYATATSLDFGTGKANTEAMIAKWNSSVYGAQNDDGTYLDMWGAIQDKVAEGWFVPSRGEWGAFGDNLGITTDNYVNYGLSGWCWSSSQFNTNLAWHANFNGGYMTSHGVNYIYSVRMSATF